MAGEAALEARLNARVVGQRRLVHALVVALLADGQVLVEGPPGLSKTRAATALAEAIEATSRRVVLDPGMRAADLIGEAAGGAAPGQVRGRAGPVFANLVLAEGIEHASPAARLALFDAMAERHVAVGGAAVGLPDVFLVCATRTAVAPRRREPAALASAERDRFLVHLRVGYPDEAAERRILGLARAEGAAPDAARSTAGMRLPLAVVLAARAKVRAVGLGPTMQRRITALVSATRGNNDLRRDGPARWIRVGAGPRASIALERCARAHVWLAGRRRATERDLAAVAHDVLRHRLELSDAAEEAGATAAAVVDQLLARPLDT